MKENPANAPWLARQERLRERLEARRLPALVVSSLPNIFYLTGFRGSAGVAAFSSRHAVLWVDPRYTLQARDTAHGVEVVETHSAILASVALWLRKHRLSGAGIEEGNLTYRQVTQLRHAAGNKVRLRAAGGVVEDLRLIKDAGELDTIRRACRLTADVFDEIRPEIHPGAREADLGAEIEYRMRRKGAEGVAFETIVASGPRGALPHARASSKLLEKNDLVIFDLGAILAGYASDMTRTVYLGSPCRRVQELYQAVLDAQQGAIAALRTGVRGEEVDAVARGILKARKLDRRFSHSTGHGVGIEVHERPRLARGEKGNLPAGCVVTVEPGVYLEGFGGIRIEDTVSVGDDGPAPLTDASRAEWYIS